MTKPKAKKDALENAVEYPIDEQFVDMRSRQLKRVFVVVWIVAQIWLWCWYFLPPARSDWISILGADIMGTFILLLAPYIAPFFDNHPGVIMTETRVIYCLPDGGAKEIVISKENPVEIRKDASGKNWVLSSSTGTSKTLKLPCVAYSHLEKFIAEAPKVLDGSRELTGEFHNGDDMTPSP